MQRQRSIRMILTAIPSQVQSFPDERLHLSVEEPSDAVSNLNNIGVTHLEASQNDDAMQCFQSALLKLKHVKNSMCQFKSSTTSYSTPCSPGDAQPQDPITDTEDSAVSTDNYIHQRREYDEGMHVFSSPLRLDLPVYDTCIASQNVAAAVLLFNIGQLCLLGHQDDEANECFVRALFLAQRVAQTASANNVGVVSIVAILHNIGYIQYRNSDLEKALRTYNDALQVPRHLSNKIEMAATLNCLGVLYFHLPKSDTSRAMDCYTKSLAIRQEIIGTVEHCDVATTLNNIGRVHYIKGEYDLALAKYLEALRIRRSLLGRDHLDVAATVYNAGQTFHQQGDLEKALKYYQEFMSITVPKLGQSHRDVAIMLKCMAQIYHERREYERALGLYEEALSVGRAALGMHAEVASILNKMGNLHYEQGDFDNAIQRYQQGLEVERSVLHNLHPNITVTLTNIGQIHKQRGEYHSALRL
jgi:tetratricopeptide (TPR) repeat protein